VKSVGVSADTSGMRHIIAEVSDIPAAPPALDRRRTPDRRAEWRGGRRDSDWINRPPDALAKLQARQSRASMFKRALFSVTHLW
jgi:hypothetical protein